MQKSIEDCYYFYYSTCTKGDACTFRHCQKALGTEIVCNNWLAKNCNNYECPYRHMLITKNRSTIQCYWETTPSGCQKAHCPFLHVRDKPKVGIVTPTTTQPVVTQQPAVQTTANRIVVKDEEKPQQMIPNGETVAKIVPNTCVVAPVIVKMGMNEDEESDSDSNATYKQKQAPQTQRKIVADKPKVISLKKSAEIEQPSLKIGVKSLEEIRKEKALKAQTTEQPQVQPTPTEAVKPTTIQVKSNVEDAELRREKRLKKFGQITTSSSISNGTTNTVTTSTTSTGNVAQSNVIKLNKVKSSEEIRQKPQQNQETAAVVKTLADLKKEKNIMNIITNTISENQATAQVQATKAATAQITATKTATVSTSASSSATTKAGGESLKIKTLEEIKAEKEMKKRLLQQQQQQQIEVAEQKIESAEEKALDSSQDSMDVQIKSPQSETASGRKLRLRKSTKESTQVSSIVETKDHEITKNKENSSAKTTTETTTVTTTATANVVVPANVPSKRKLSINAKPVIAVPVNGNANVSAKSEQNTTQASAVSEEVTVVNKKAKTTEIEHNLPQYYRSDSEFEKKLLQESLSVDESMHVELEIKANDSKDADFSDLMSDSFVSSRNQNETEKKTVKTISSGTKSSKSEIDKEMDELMKLCDDDDFL